MEIDTNEMKKLELALMRANEVGVRIAQEQTVNDLAFEARRIAKAQGKKKFIVRNQWTYSARNNPIDKATRGKANAEFGSTLGYMERQEFGYLKRPDSHTGAIAIATPVASGERKGGAAGKTIRRKAVRKPNYKNKLQMPSKKFKQLPRKQRNAALIQEALKTKKRFIELERNGETNIFKVVGSKKKYRLDRMYKTEHKTISVKPRKWLHEATGEAYKRFNEFYVKRIGYQIERLLKRR